MIPSLNVLESARLRHRGAKRAAWTLLATGAILTCGCTPTDPPTNPVPDELSGSIGPDTNLQLRGENREMPFSILYSIVGDATSRSAFYVPVDGTSPDANTIGVRVPFADEDDLDIGENLTVPLDPSGIDTGYYRCGLQLASSDESLTAWSFGTFEITELPPPSFTLPNQDLTVVPGVGVEITALFGDLQTPVNWRMFYVDASQPIPPGTPADQLGREITNGTANIAQLTWNTTDVEFGVYRIGASVTDSGLSIADTVAAGNADSIKTSFNDFSVTFVETAPGPQPPLVAVTDPAFRTVVSTADPMPVIVRFTVEVFEGPPAEQGVDVYYDFDGVADTGDEVVFAADLPISATSVLFNAEQFLDAGDVVWLGVVADDGRNAPVANYAPGVVAFLSPDELPEPMLTVIEPSDPTKQYRKLEEVFVSWQLDNLLSGTDGTTQVELYRLDSDLQPVGDPIVCCDTEETRCFEPVPLPGASATICAPESGGLFQVRVTTTFSNVDLDPLVDTAPQNLRVSNLPRIAWMGDLSPDVNTCGIRVGIDDLVDRYQPSPLSPVEGAIFEGHNFEDNAGLSFAGGVDFDDDGHEELVINARYAKPGFINPNGVGIGEAYMIRGAARSKYAGLAIDLNEIGRTEPGSEEVPLPGVVFTGPNSDVNDDTYGLSTVFLSGDADGDEKGELWFGIPFTNSVLVDPRVDGEFDPRRNIEREGMFVNGGVVAVSSRNSFLATAEQDDDNVRVPLDHVGMFFDRNVVSQEPTTSVATGCSGPSPGEPDFCLNEDWFVDFYGLVDGVCPPDGPINEDYCSSAPGDRDGDPDTLVEPTHGFTPYLANNFFESRTAPARGVFTDECVHCCNLIDEGLGTSCTCFQFSSENAAVWADYSESECPLLVPNPGCEDNPGSPPDPPQFEGQNTVEPPAALNDLPFCESFPLVDAELGGDCTNQHEFAELVMLSQGFGRVSGGLIGGYRLNLDPTAFGVAPGTVVGSTFTGFYVDRYGGEALIPNTPQEPFGMRVIGRPQSALHDQFSLFGSSITQAGPSMVVSSPARHAYDPHDASGLDGFCVDDPDLGFCGIRNAGIMYLFDNQHYWSDPIDANQNFLDRIPPKPHMYMAGSGGNSGFIGVDPILATIEGMPPCRAPGNNRRWDLVVDKGPTDDPRVDGGRLLSTDTPRIVGGEQDGNGENIDTVVGIGDFNGDGREDVAVGSPTAFVSSQGDGQVYIVYRRAGALEGDFILEKLSLPTTNPERLDGLLIRGDDDDAGKGVGFGQAITSGIDFNRDGFQDLIIGNPNGNDGKGEVIIVFSRIGVISPENGISVNQLLAQNHAARILGVELNSEFGFNVASAGDVDGDGVDDLLIAAPSATPRFDPDLADGNDQLTEPGLDRNLDGEQDDVTGPLGCPDGVVDDADNLVHAGQVYLVYGPNPEVHAPDDPRWAPNWENADGEYEISIDDLEVTENLDGMIFVGRTGERSSTSGTFVYGDYLGGGDASHDICDFDPASAPAGTCDDAVIPDPLLPYNRGGTSAKDPLFGDVSRGRSFGVGAAGDVDGDGFGDILLGSILADPRVDPETGEGINNAGEAYLIYGVNR